MRWYEASGRRVVWLGAWLAIMLEGGFCER